MASWFGIDFGTTNSAVVSLTGIEQNSLQCISYGDDEGRPFPSIVAINRDNGTIITGREAKDNRNSLLQNHEYFSSIKSIIDRDIVWNIAGKEYTTENIASEIFKSLKTRIERDGNNQINEAVIAVPVGFSSMKKSHLRNAAKEAGITVKMFISEPTAAFYSNYDQLKGCNTVAVFDWGGGTLDVVILEIKNDSVSELASNNLPFAGDDIDKKLAERVHTMFMKNRQYPVSFENLDKTAKDRLLMECERAKRELETEDIVSVQIFKYGDFGSLKESINYDYFSLLIENDIKNALSCLEKAIEKSGKSHVEIDRILCVGGSSKLRPIQEKLKAIYGEETVYYPDSVMWDIAKGAAFTSTSQGGYLLNKPIGLMLSDNNFFPILIKNQKLPCGEVEMYFGVVDDTKIANIIITDSENPSERDFTQNMALPLCGYADESISIKCFIDENFVFRMKIQSSKMPEDTGLVWTYDKLKISYRL